MRNLFIQQALAQIPNILSRLDSNPHSPTYGSFDRNFWHHKITDFPTGTAIECVWPLALVYDLNIPENPYYQQPALRQWIEAGIFYAAKSAHPDFSCDNYFPYDRDSKATAFSLLACIETCVLLELDNPEVLNFFEKRADWLANHHQITHPTHILAAIILCLELLSQLYKTSKWKRAKAAFLEKLLQSQTQEGWFPENNGCDPGYHTLTLSHLARLYQLKPDPKLRESLIKAIEFAGQLIHPDGSYGGDNRNGGDYFFPHGFELIGRWLPEALRINDTFLQAIATGIFPPFCDERNTPLYVSNYLLAGRDFVSDRPLAAPRPISRFWFQQAQIFIDRRNFTNSPTLPSAPPTQRPSANTELYVVLSQGGAFKLFRDGKLVASDTHFSVVINQNNQIKNYTANLTSQNTIELEKEQIIIQGQLQWVKQQNLTPKKLILQRLIALSLGRFFPQLISLHHPKNRQQNPPLHFTRRLRWQTGQLLVIDELECDNWENVIAVGIGSSLTSANTQIKRIQNSKLPAWIDLTATAQKLSSGDVLKLERRL
ncbi:hypothetical protein NG798_19050 [Ancylothrix sp. C2]|uniref:hypothetical protein n=1 Tax=Ancylothrix sp. D3o TaxID=2953691 RepID=UPI0021BB68AA|nr:hypothetical protein [Ancylothrix sp. D3o]MCT7951903.1 hypothetical protein [Ancylothrix sp. D3o]